MDRRIMCLLEQITPLGGDDFKKSRRLGLVFPVSEARSSARGRGFTVTTADKAKSVDPETPSSEITLLSTFVTTSRSPLSPQKRQDIQHTRWHPGYLFEKCAVRNLPLHSSGVHVPSFRITTTIAVLLPHRIILGALDFGNFPA